MKAQVPPQPSTYADEGQTAHDLAATVLKGLRQGTAVSTHRRLIGMGDPIITEEMFDAVEIYARDVKDVMTATRIFGGHVGTEAEVDLSAISPSMKGTVDHWMYDEKTHILYVWDFKYGHGLVEVWENLQLVLYAWGLIAALPATDHPDLTIDMRIVQPRGFHPDGPIRSWVTDYNGISTYGTQLAHAATEAAAIDAKTHSGSHCRYCEARHMCPSAQSAGLLAAEYSREPVPAEMNPATLGTYLTTAHRASEALNHIITGLEAQAKVVIRGGSAVPGFSLAPSPGNLKWTVPDDTIDTLATMMKKDLMVVKPITPTQAIAAGIPEAIIVRYASRPNRGSKLVPDDGSSARKIFSKPAVQIPQAVPPPKKETP